MNPLPPGEVGRLAVRGPTGCRYLDDPRQTSYVVGGWNLTGDAFRMDADGYFWFQARTDDMIISSGYNISGAEVESALLEHPAVAECAVVASPDEERGHVVKAFVVVTPDATPGDALAADLQAHVKARIAPYKYPRRVEFLDALPRTPTGKVQRTRAAGDGPGARDEDPPAAGLAAAAGVRERRSRPSGGTLVFVAGQIGWDETGAFPPPTSPARSARRSRNVLAVLAEAGARPEHVVRLTWYVTDREEYLASAREIGAAYRELMGGHFPAMAVVRSSGAGRGAGEGRDRGDGGRSAEIV